MSKERRPPGEVWLPDLDDHERTVKVALPRPNQHSAVGTMVRDLIDDGDLNAATAIFDWLNERAEHRDRSLQLAGFTRLFNRLIVACLMRSEELEKYATDPHGLCRRFYRQLAKDWCGFCWKVRELFAGDLYDLESSIRFVDQVMRPGQLGEFLG